MFLVWVVFSMLMAALMWARPGEETIPFHLIYIAFCLLYGFAIWPLRLTVVGIAALLLISTLALSRSALRGAIGWSELSEVPFMAILALLLVWHVRRRQRAAQQVVEAAARDLLAALDTLVENALRHTDTGDQICLEGWWEGDQVVIEVRDSGRGLSADQAFAINNGDESWVADGTSHSGLGLQIVRQVVTARSGTVVVGSAAEGGAAVVLRMPLARATATKSVATDLPALPRQHARPARLTTR